MKRGIEIRNLDDVEEMVSDVIAERDSEFTKDDVYRIARLNMKGSRYVIGRETLIDVVEECLIDAVSKGYVGINQVNLKYFNKEIS